MNSASYGGPLQTIATISQHAMDWFYPVLCGVVTGGPARERLEAGMDRLLEEGLGSRCVADDP